MTTQTGEVRLTLTVEEAARRFGIGRRAAYTAVAKGQLHAIKLGRKLRVPIASLEKMLSGPDIAPPGR